MMPDNVPDFQLWLFGINKSLPKLLKIIFCLPHCILRQTLVVTRLPEHRLCNW